MAQAKNIKLVRLLSGEDLLAEVNSNNSDEYELTNVVRVVVVPSRTSPQDPQVGFAPWFDFSDQKTYTIRRDHVLAFAEPIAPFLDQYNSLFSKIIQPAAATRPSGLIGI